MPGPLFLVDRSLGRVRVPALLREAGWSLVTLSEHYGVPADESVADVEWLRLAGERGWPVLMTGRYRSAEHRALVAHGVRAFVLTSGSVRAQAMADCFDRHRDEIWRRATDPGAAVHIVSTTTIRRVDV